MCSTPRVDDVVMASLPPFHAFGLTVTLIMPLIEGIPIACHPDPTDVVGIARTVAKYRGTILFGTATFLNLYARNRKVDPILLESLRIVVAGAEKLPRKGATRLPAQVQQVHPGGLRRY